MSTDTHAQSLSAIDASFLHVETPQAHMHIGWSALFAPPPESAERPTVDALRARAAARLHWVPRLRQRLAPSPLGPLGDPRWADDEHFDLREHVLAVTEPGAGFPLASFGLLRDRILSEPLDRRRPLWQVVLVPHLEDGRVGVIGRVHHALADGTAALVMATLLLDADGGADEVPVPWTPRRAPGVRDWAATAAAGGARAAHAAALEGVRAVNRPRTAIAGGLRLAGQVADAVREDLLPRATDCALNAPNGPRRTLEGERLPLTDLHAVRRRHGGTVNDVALTLVSGALRRLALEQGEAPVPLKAMIPVSVRRPQELNDLGNRISQVMVWLPVDAPTAPERLQAVREQTERFKARGRREGHTALLAGVGLLRGPLRDVLLRTVASSRTYNLTVSNVRGPDVPLRLFGGELQELLPVVPIGHGHALAIGMVSHAGVLHFGLHADPDALPDGGRLPALLRAELDDLLGRGSRNGATPPRPRRLPELVPV